MAPTRPRDGQAEALEASVRGDCQRPGPRLHVGPSPSTAARLPWGSPGRPEVGQGAPRLSHGNKGDMRKAGKQQRRAWLSGNRCPAPHPWPLPLHPKYGA